MQVQLNTTNSFNWPDFRVMCSPQQLLLVIQSLLKRKLLFSITVGSICTIRQTETLLKSREQAFQSLAALARAHSLHH